MNHVAKLYVRIETDRNPFTIHLKFSLLFILKVYVKNERL